MLSDSELDGIDEWRFKNRIGTRAEAIRRLVQMGLFADGIAAGAESVATHLLNRDTEMVSSWGNRYPSLPDRVRMLRTWVDETFPQRFELVVNVSTINDVLSELKNGALVEDAISAATEKRLQHQKAIEHMWEEYRSGPLEHDE